ncbi:MAG: hypothetical protein OXI76_08590 [Gemmatimonadota bacterium]|nr:hypothetical protein [Gemmatimonadota bacterium]
MTAPGVEDADLMRLPVGHDHVARPVAPGGGDPAEEKLVRAGELADGQQRLLGEFSVDEVARRVGDDPDPGGVGDLQASG